MTSLLSILAVLSAIAGILLLWFVLRNFFDVTTSLVTLSLVVFGTNYFRWIFFDGATPHNFLFTLFAAAVLLTLKWQRDPQWIWLLIMLPVVVLACFIHDLSVFIMLLPLLYGIHDSSSWLETRRKMRNNPCQYGFLLLILFLAYALTRFAWFAKPGTLFYYGDANAGVYPFLAANFQLILFSFNKGWFIYTPMMILVFPGMYILAERNRNLFFGLFFYFTAWFLMAASHPMWSTGPGFGQRFFIETYAVLALPLGYMVQWIFEKKTWLKIILLILPSLFLLFNLFQTWQYTKGIIVPVEMNQDYYKAVFGKLSADSACRKLLVTAKPKENEEIPANIKYKITRLQDWDFDIPLPGYEQWHDTVIRHSGKGSWRLCKEKAFSPSFSKKIAELTTQDTIWLRVTAWLYFECHRAENHVNLVFACSHKGAVYKFVTKNFADKFQPGTWNYISFDYQLPLHLQDRQDEVIINFWDYGERDCFIDDFTIDIFEPETNR